jgi:hypothetical protein
MGKSLHAVSEDHAQRSAAGMIAAYGADAEKICLAQLEKMRRRKDGAGEQVWQGVLRQIALSREMT